MTDQELDAAKIIAIVGRPGVGKTTLAKQLAREKGCRIIHTDDYIKKFKFSEAAEGIIDICKGEQPPYIVEGVQVARMLRKGFKPDVVIIMNANDRPQTHHKGLAVLTANAVKEWLATEHGAKVHYFNKDLK